MKTLLEMRAGKTKFESLGNKAWQSGSGLPIPLEMKAESKEMKAFLDQVIEEFDGVSGQLMGHALIRERWTDSREQVSRFKAIWGSYRGEGFWDFIFGGSPGQGVQFRRGPWEKWPNNLPLCAQFRQKYPVYFSPYCATLLHEAVGHALEDEYLLQSPLAPKIGTRYCVDDLTILDQPELTGLAGSMKFDDTGQAATETTLVHRGCFVGDLDRQKGVWRRGSFKSKPLIRATNFFIKKGTANPEDWMQYLPDLYFVAWIEKGKWLPGTQDIEVRTGPVFRIRNGEPTACFHHLVLRYKSLAFLKAIQAVGNDTKLDPVVHWCVKKGQGVPMSLISPSLLVDNCFEAMLEKER